MTPSHRSRLVSALLTLAVGCASSASDGPVSGGFDEAPDIPDEEGVGPGPFSQPARLSRVLTSEQPVPPISGGTLAVSDDGAFAVAADPDRDAVYVIDLGARRSKSVQLELGSEPGRALLGAGHAHVLLRQSGQIARIDLATAVVAQRAPVCEHPRGVALDGAADALLVACANGELVTLAAATYAEISRTFVALDLRDVIVAGERRYVSRYRSAELLHIDGEGKVMATTRPAREVRHGRKGKVTFSAALAWRTIGSTDGGLLMIHQKSQNEEVVLGDGGYGSGCDTITQTGATMYDERGEPARTFSFSGAAYGVDIAFDRAHEQIAIASPGGYLSGISGTLQLIDSSRFKAAVSAGGDGDAGVASSEGLGVPSPDALCETTPIAAHDEQVTAVAFDQDGMLYALSREPAELLLYDTGGGERAGLRLRDRIVLGTRSVRDSGHELFHADVGSGLACASCHGEALDDGHVWSFSGFGPRRTQNMRGGLSRTLPLHWEGELKTFQDLVSEVMTHRMGGFPVAHEFGNALVQWIDAQPPLRVKARDREAALRGKALFESVEVGCATCHAGDMLTNNENADVGTGGSFQVPSLLGLALRAPYMHDGCAKTLRERFEPKCGGGDRHGKTSRLSERELADLVAYLESL